MNLVLAIVLHTTVFAVGVKVPAYELAPAVIGVVAENSPAAAGRRGARRPDRLRSTAPRLRAGATREYRDSR